LHVNQVIFIIDYQYYFYLICFIIIVESIISYFVYHTLPITIIGERSTQNTSHRTIILSFDLDTFIR